MIPDIPINRIPKLNRKVFHGSSSYIYIYIHRGSDKSESISPFLINLRNIKCLKLNCVYETKDRWRGRLRAFALLPFLPETKRTSYFIIPISRNWIVSRLESFKLSSRSPSLSKLFLPSPDSYPYHVKITLSRSFLSFFFPFFHRIRVSRRERRKARRRGNDSFWDAGFRIISLLSFFRPPPHFCADQTQRHSDLKEREGSA